MSTPQLPGDDFTLLRLAELADRLAAVEERLQGDGGEPAGVADEDEEGYSPKPAPRWWLLQGQDRADAVEPLRAWVEQVYRPGYGHLAAMLPACWEQHPLCLYALDWLSELWQVLYLQPERGPMSLASQAEWQTRLLPTAAEQMARAAANCRHRPGARA